MAFDPQREDYQRMGLRFAHTLDSSSPAEATRAFASFSRRFARERDSLPQSDSDRAFHLVAIASKLIDYELPFADDAEAQKLIERGHQLLDEALSLDPRCFDAIRMKAAADKPSFEAYLEFLNEQSDEVWRTCNEQSTRILQKGTNDERALLEASLAMHPYLRWVSTQAEQALICGRNKQSIQLCLHALEVDPHDEADIRFTAALAYAKLEDAQGLATLIQNTGSKLRTRPANDAWTQLSLIALAHKTHDLQSATDLLADLARLYPHAAETLLRQIELPEGVFARLAVKPYSEDELVLALSEATVLLQEGREPNGRGVLGAWISNEAAQMLPPAVASMIAEQMRDLMDGRGDVL